MIVFRPLNKYTVQIQSIRAYLLDYGDSKDRFDHPPSALVPYSPGSVQLLRSIGEVRVRIELCTAIPKAKDVAKSGFHTARTVSA